MRAEVRAARDAEVVLRRGPFSDCPDCRDGRGFHLRATRVFTPKRVLRPQHHVFPSPLTLGGDGIWRSREPVEAR